MATTPQAGLKKNGPTGGTVLLAENQVHGRNVRVWTSGATEAPAWDAFLTGTPLGQFQQSSHWAGVKQQEGWKPIRRLFTCEDAVVGGFQVLARRSRFGRVGYVSKGPVLLADHAQVANLLLEHMTRCARENGLRALIVQPPDACRIFLPLLARKPFLENHVLRVIRANYVIDTSKGFAAVKKRMHAKTLQRVRQAARRGVSIRDGEREDLPVFFELMLATCERQGNVHPNPSRVELLVEMWDRFRPSGSIRLAFAQCDGAPVSGQLSILFGNRTTFLKKGWSGTHADRRPNQLLQYEEIKRAAEAGFACCDFAGLDTGTAKAMLRGAGPPAGPADTRDTFNLAFGGTPVLLPEARLLVPIPLLRTAYAVIAPRLARLSLTRRLAQSVAG